MFNFYDKKLVEEVNVSTILKLYTRIPGHYEGEEGFTNIILWWYVPARGLQILTLGRVRGEKSFLDTFPLFRACK